MVGHLSERSVILKKRAGFQTSLRGLSAMQRLATAPLHKRPSALLRQDMSHVSRMQRKRCRSRRRSRDVKVDAALSVYTYVIQYNII